MRIYIYIYLFFIYLFICLFKSYVELPNKQPYMVKLPTKAEAFCITLAFCHVLVGYNVPLFFAGYQDWQGSPDNAIWMIEIQM